MEYEKLLNKPFDYFLKKYKSINSGSSRVVFDLDNGESVLKHSNQTKKGIHQTKTEIKIYSELGKVYNFLCPIYAYSEEIIIMMKVLVITNKNIPIDKVSIFNEFNKKLYDFRTVFLEKDDKILSVLYSEQELRDIRNDKLYKELCSLISLYNLHFEDIFNPMSWGFKDDKFWLLDYGLTMDTFFNYY